MTKYIIISDDDYEDNSLINTPLHLATSLKEAKQIRKELVEEDQKAIDQLSNVDIYVNSAKYRIYKIEKVC